MNCPKSLFNNKNRLLIIYKKFRLEEIDYFNINIAKIMVQHKMHTNRIHKQWINLIIIFKHKIKKIKNKKEKKYF